MLTVATAQKAGHTLHISVNERVSREPVIMATLKLMPAEVMAVTDMNGKATINNVPSGE